MPLKDRELATINPAGAGRYTVTLFSEDGQMQATFDCASEKDAVALRYAIREHCEGLRHVVNFRG